MSMMTNVKDVKVGDKIKPLDVPGVTDVAALGIGVVTANNTNTRVPHIWADFTGSSYRKVSLIVHGWELVECDDATPAEQQSNEVERLNQRIKELEDTTTSQVLRINHLIKALEIVNERLNEEASNRGWCSEFDDILDQVNIRIGNEANGCFALEGNTEEYEVQIVGEATVYWTYTVTVDAKSEEDAIAMVEDNPDSYFDMSEAAEEQINNGNGWDNIEINDVSIA